jgi:D-sedoheptulose 7-phosphate isomerase
MDDSPVAKGQCVTGYLLGLRQCLDALPLDQVVVLLETLERAYREERQVFVIGNGGSAATASHMACDLGKNIQAAGGNQRRFRVMALTDSSSWMTALANDLGYQNVFAEPLRNWIQAGDLLIAISGSGNSPSIIEAVRVAKERDARVLGILGFDGGLIRTMADACVIVPSQNYGHIEDIHLVLSHLATAYFQSCAER